MRLDSMTLAQLREALRQRRGMLQIARQGTGSTAELERGIRTLEVEIARREAFQQPGR